MSASVHANSPSAKKVTRGRKREKRVPLLGVGKTIVGSLLFLVWLFFHVRFNAFSDFF